MRNVVATKGRVVRFKMERCSIRRVLVPSSKHLSSRKFYRPQASKIAPSSHQLQRNCRIRLIVWVQCPKVTSQDRRKCFRKARDRWVLAQEAKRAIGHTHRTRRGLFFPSPRPLCWYQSLTYLYQLMTSSMYLKNITKWKRIINSQGLKNR